MKKIDFEEFVERAFSELPEDIKKKIENVAICVEDEHRNNPAILGLYEGVPKTAWGRGFGGNIPDKITVFEKSILRFAKNEREAYDITKSTVYHEIAHHFGFSEEEVSRWERKRNSF